jgi:hypothetical protein
MNLHLCTYIYIPVKYRCCISELDLTVTQSLNTKKNSIITNYFIVDLQILMFIYILHVNSFCDEKDSAILKVPTVSLQKINKITNLSN